MSLPANSVSISLKNYAKQIQNSLFARNVVRQRQPVSFPCSASVDKRARLLPALPVVPVVVVDTVQLVTRGKQRQSCGRKRIVYISKKILLFTNRIFFILVYEKIDGD